jgi:colanic acid/amylovoran biosynthesis protein
LNTLQTCALEKIMKFYLAGHTNFGNRGCEALVRSIVEAITLKFGPSEFLVPSVQITADARQWPEMEKAGGRFVQGLTVPVMVKWWNRLIRVMPATKALWAPKCPLPGYAAQDLQGCDAVLMIGGDIISLDYGPGSLFMWSSFMDAARRADYPTMLYAASVGPFKDPVIEQYMVAHLKRYSAITVRESASFAYLQTLGLKNASLVADPAFRLGVQECNLEEIFTTPNDGVLGFNLSPLIEAGWALAGNTGSLVSEAVAFLKKVLAETSHSIALIPHVDPLDGSDYNSDSKFMQRILGELGGASHRLALVKPGLNAAQLKHVIGSCRFFIGARTHATVAAWSRGVPTTSIAYSVKAKGLNKDLFGSLDYVLETPQLNQHTLWEHLSKLQKQEGAIRTHLAERIPQWRENALLSTQQLATAMKSAG